jgi:hypothetical protein
VSTLSYLPRYTENQNAKLSHPCSSPSSVLPSSSRAPFGAESFHRLAKLRLSSRCTLPPPLSNLQARRLSFSPFRRDSCILWRFLRSSPIPCTHAKPSCLAFPASFGSRSSSRFAERNSRILPRSCSWQRCRLTSAEAGSSHFRRGLVGESFEVRTKCLLACLGRYAGLSRAKFKTQSGYVSNWGH